jgi:hypothetical protein
MDKSQTEEEASLKLKRSKKDMASDTEDLQRN